jgi:hypothetical protein
MKCLYQDSIIWYFCCGCKFLTLHVYVLSLSLSLSLSLTLFPVAFFQFNFFTLRELVEPLGRGISPSQGRYLHTEQHKYRINAHTDIHALSEIRTYDPSVRASEDSCVYIT